MAAGIVHEDAGGAALVPATDVNEAVRAGPLCAWLYAGSHNLSGAAWGKAEKKVEREAEQRTTEGGSDDESDDDDDDDDSVEFVVMAYEIGVLLVPPKPRRFALPWRSPALQYDPVYEKPFSTNRYLAILRGQQSFAWGSGKDGATPRQQAEDGAQLVQRRWRSLEHGLNAAAAPAIPGASRAGTPANAGAVTVAGADAALRLPPLLKMELGRLPKLVSLRVTAPDAVRLMAKEPEPGSEARRRAKHLKRLSRNDELLSLTTSSHRFLPVDTRLRAVRLRDFSYGRGDEKAPGDPIITVYQVIKEDERDLTLGDGSHFVDDFDRSSLQLTGQPEVAAPSQQVQSASAQQQELIPTGMSKRSSRSSIWVEHNEKPRGVLIAFLAEDEGAQRERNDALLYAVAACREQIEAACWGMLCLQPSELAGLSEVAADGRPVNMTPLHADLLALEFGIEPSFELPALVLLTADLQESMLCVKGAAEMAELQATAGEQLRGALVKLSSRECSSLTGKKLSLWKRMHEQRTMSAQAAAEWVRAAAWMSKEARQEPLQARYEPQSVPALLSPKLRLLMIEPEGILKKQCNISVVGSATTALAKRRKSLWGAARKDSFLSACVPFLRALLIHLPQDTDDYDPTSMFGEGPPSATLRNDAPEIALVTNLGHLVSKHRPGESMLLEERQVRRVLATLLRRLASELGVGEAALAAKVSVFVSYRAPGVDGDGAALAATASALQQQQREAKPPSDKVLALERELDEGLVATWAAARHDEWSAEWAKPCPGMLLAAMRHHGVEAAQALMVGYDFNDLEAASRAGVAYIDQRHLLGVESFDVGFDADRIADRLIKPGVKTGAKAPDSFAPEKMKKRKAASADLPAHTRSPSSKKGASGAASRE